MCLFGGHVVTRFQRISIRGCRCWRQPCLEDDFDALLRKGQPRYANQIAGALRPRLGVGFFAHLARDRKRLIDIEDIERLFHHMVEGSSELCQDRCSVGRGHRHLLRHHREVGWLAGFIERSRRDHAARGVVAELLAKGRVLLGAGQHLRFQAFAGSAAGFVHRCSSLQRLFTPS
jgi:hypothetical protein